MTFPHQDAHCDNAKYDKSYSNRYTGELGNTTCFKCSCCNDDENSRCNPDKSYFCGASDKLK